MSIADAVARLNATLERAATWLVSPWLLALRVYVAWQFLKSGWLKLTTWDTTLALFHDEYHVPLLPPDVAAVFGTAGELVFPALLILGLCTRLGALGLFAVNIMAVVSYAHVLLSEGFEAAIGQHYLWGTIIATLVIFGPGQWSLDAWLQARSGRLAR